LRQRERCGGHNSHCRERLLLIARAAMELVQIYECLCDRTRLRILRLLAETPLCVCHFQEILGEPQVKISKHLAYLRARGIVETQQSKNWVIYSLPKKRPRELDRNLKCLRECVDTDRGFAADLKKLKALQSGCCEPAELFADRNRAARVAPPRSRFEHPRRARIGRG
jgi:ArsR family transcriptional regulator